MVVTQRELEDNLEWKTTLDGRQPWMEDNLGWKMTLDERRPWIEDDLGLKKTLDGSYLKMFLGPAIFTRYLVYDLL